MSEGKEEPEDLWGDGHDLTFDVGSRLMTKQIKVWSAEVGRGSSLPAWMGFANAANVYCREDPEDGWTPEDFHRVFSDAMLKAVHPCGPRTVRKYATMSLTAGLFEPHPRRAGKIRLALRLHHWARRLGARRDLAWLELEKERARERLADEQAYLADRKKSRGAR